MGVYTVACVDVVPADQTHSKHATVLAPLDPSLLDLGLYHATSPSRPIHLAGSTNIVARATPHSKPPHAVGLGRAGTTLHGPPSGGTHPFYTAPPTCLHFLVESFAPWPQLTYSCLRPSLVGSPSPLSNARCRCAAPSPRARRPRWPSSRTSPAALARAARRAFCPPPTRTLPATRTLRAAHATGARARTRTPPRRTRSTSSSATVRAARATAARAPSSWRCHATRSKQALLPPTRARRTHVSATDRRGMHSFRTRVT